MVRDVRRKVIDTKNKKRPMDGVTPGAKGKSGKNPPPHRDPDAPASGVCVADINVSDRKKDVLTISFLHYGQSCQVHKRFKDFERLDARLTAMDGFAGPCLPSTDELMGVRRKLDLGTFNAKRAEQIITYLAELQRTLSHEELLNFLLTTAEKKKKGGRGAKGAVDTKAKAKSEKGSPELAESDSGSEEIEEGHVELPKLRNKSPEALGKAKPKPSPKKHAKKGSPTRPQKEDDESGNAAQKPESAKSPAKPKASNKKKNEGDGKGEADKGEVLDDGNREEEDKHRPKETAKTGEDKAHGKASPHPASDKSQPKAKPGNKKKTGATEADKKKAAATRDEGKNEVANVADLDDGKAAITPAAGKPLPKPKAGNKKNSPAAELKGVAEGEGDADPENGNNDPKPKSDDTSTKSKSGKKKRGAATELPIVEGANDRKGEGPPKKDPLAPKPEFFHF